MIVDMQPEHKTQAPRRSDATKAAILDAARDRFGTLGFERATIRAIAEKAGIDPAMVMRYYGNKQKLFAAAAEIDLALPDLTKVPRAQVGITLARHFFSRWERDGALQTLLRSAVTNRSAAERMRSLFASQVAPALAPLFTDRQVVATRAGLIATQTLGVALCRYVLRLPPVVALSDHDLVEWVGPTLQRYLDENAPTNRDSPTS